MTRRDYFLVVVAVLLAFSLGISTYTTNSAARDAAVEAHIAKEHAELARASVEEHRLASERHSTELAEFIVCALNILPEERTEVVLEKCKKRAGINE